MRGQVVANIIKFPKDAQAPPPQGQTAEPAPAMEAPRPKNTVGVLKVLWVATVMLWPWLKWIVVLDVLFQLGRMVYHWNTPGSFARWTFLLHFGVLTAMTYFVSTFKPKDL